MEHEEQEDGPSRPPRDRKPRNLLAGLYLKGARAVAVRSFLESRGVTLRSVAAVEAVPTSEAERRRCGEVTRPLGKARERQKCEGTVMCPSSGSAGTVVKCPTCGGCGPHCCGHAQFFSLPRTVFAPMGMKNLPALLGCFQLLRSAGAPGDTRLLRLGPLLGGGEPPRALAPGENPRRLWREWPAASQRAIVTEVRAATAAAHAHGGNGGRGNGGRGGGSGGRGSAGGGGGGGGRCGVAALRVTPARPEAGETGPPVSEVWTPERVREELLFPDGARRPEAEFEALGFPELPGDGGDAPRAAWCEAVFFWDSVYVTPYPTRQAVRSRTAADAPDLTSKYNKLFRDCRAFEALAARGAPSAELETFWAARVVDELHTMVLRNPRVAASAAGGTRPPQHAVAATLHGKKMLLRGMLSRRRDGIARAVICPRSDTPAGWVGLCLAMMNGLTVTEALRPWNAAALKASLLQLTERPGAPQLFVGPPGAPPGRRNLFEEARDRREVREVILGLADGWTVTRSLLDGDVVFFNRQPTLWDNSYLAYRARLTAERHVITFSPLDCARFNADYDGDEMNVVPARFQDGAAEALALASAERRAITSKDGGPVLSWTLDSMVGFNLASRAAACVSRDQAAAILRSASAAAVSAAARLLPKEGPVCARDLLSACVTAHLGRDFCYSAGGVTYVADGAVVAELTMKQLARAQDGLLVAAIRDRGYAPALAFLADSDLVCCGLAAAFGVTLHAGHYEFRLRASAALPELAYALRVLREAQAWTPDNAPERTDMLVAAVRELLLVPFGVPRDRWETVFAAVGDASLGAEEAAARAFRAAGVSQDAVSAAPAEVDRLASYGLPLLRALRRLRGRPAEEAFDAFVTSLKTSASALIRASLDPLHPLLLFLVLAITKNKGNLDAVNAQLGSRANRAVVPDAFEGRATCSHAAGSDDPAAARYFATSQKRGLKPVAQAAAGAHARANMASATAGTQEPGDKNKVANFAMTDTFVAPSGAVLEADGTPIAVAYGDLSGRDEMVTLRLAPVPNPPLAPPPAAGVPFDPAAPWASSLRKVMRLPVPVAAIYDELARTSAKSTEKVTEHQVRSMYCFNTIHVW